MFHYWKKKSKYFKNWPIRKFFEIRKKLKVKNISILGLTYKPETDSLKNSPSLKLINKLNSLGGRVYNFQFVSDGMKGWYISK